VRYCRELQCVVQVVDVMCYCSVLQCVAVCCSQQKCVREGHMMQCCCSVLLQCVVAVCSCSVLQCVAVNRGVQCWDS
jgi:hypothetical protein